MTENGKTEVSFQGVAHANCLTKKLEHDGVSDAGFSSAEGDSHSRAWRGDTVFCNICPFIFLEVNSRISEI